MSDALLSQSLIQNSSDSQMSRDPFQQARNQYESRRSPSDSTILSSSPFQPQSPTPAVEPIADINPMLDKLGIDSKGLAMNEMGRVQLVGRLRDKFGEAFMQNQEALSILEMFDKKINGDGGLKQLSFNNSMSNADRTLQALMGMK